LLSEVVGLNLFSRYCHNEKWDRTPLASAGKIVDRSRSCVPRIGRMAYGAGSSSSSSAVHSRRAPTGRLRAIFGLHGIIDLINPLAHSFRHSGDGPEDVCVARAATQAGRQDLAQFPLVELAWLLEYPGCQHQETWRAKPALQAMMLPERLLQRMQDVSDR
jgi:hypothetical protein